MYIVILLQLSTESCRTHVLVRNNMEAKTLLHRTEHNHGMWLKSV